MQANPDAVMRTWFEDLWNQGKEETIERLFAADGLAHGLPGGVPLRGPDAFKPFFRGFRGAFPDLRIEVLRSVTEGEMVAVHCRVVGTHRGDTLGFAATGKPTEYSGMCFARVRNGQIVEAWNTFDFLTFYQQLGLLPNVPS